MNTHHYATFTVKGKDSKEAEKRAKELCVAYFGKDPYVITEMVAGPVARVEDLKDLVWQITVTAEKSEKSPVKHS